MATVQLGVSCLLLALVTHYVYTASVSSMTTLPATTTRRHHGHHYVKPTHSSEPSENAHLIFHFDQYSIEKLLVAKQGNSCYAYPLMKSDLNVIHTPIELFKLEGHLMHQIAQKAYVDWSFDDLAVRSRYYSNFCKDHFNVYRVHRL